MKLHNLEVTFHRTVRVAEGRAASNLPPSLGLIKLYKVADHSLERLASFVDAIVGKRLTYARLIAKVPA